MKTTWKWLVVGIVVVVLLTMTLREGFDATSTIKNPNTWNDAEITRIRNMAQKPSELTVTNAEIQEVVGGFWSYDVPSRLPNEPPTPKGWSVATSTITSADVSQYLNGIISTNPAYAAKREQFRELITAYYITQGQSVFQRAREYVATYTASTSEIQNPTDVTAEPDTTTPDLPPTELARPSATMEKIKQDVSVYTGLPRSDSAAVNAYVKEMQKFYDTVYLPDKKQPTESELDGFVNSVDIDTVPARLRNNFRSSLKSALDSYFSPTIRIGEVDTAGTGAGEPSGSASSSTSGAASTATGVDPGAGGGAGSGSAGGPIVPTGGRTVWGPVYRGRGQGPGQQGGDSTSSNLYPALLGGVAGMGGRAGMSESGVPFSVGAGLEEVMPSPSALGTGVNSRFLPYSRQPGDMDVVPDPYRLANNFSTSSYSASKTDPVPFLTDFSAFYR
jgi:hypothetical protein